MTEKADEYVDSFCRAIDLLSRSITYDTVTAGNDPYGSVASLTEAVMGVSHGLQDIASAIREHTEVISARDNRRITDP